MFKSIRVKLFLTLLLAALLVVTGMYGFMRFSFERGFMAFVESRQEKHLERIVSALTEYYDAHGTWQSLADDKQKWLEIIWQQEGHKHPPPPWLHETLSNKDTRWPPDLLDKQPKHPAHHPDNDFKPRLIPFEMRVMLLAADKSLVFGRSELVSELTLHPIRSAGTIVGYVGVLPGKPFNQLGDIQFMEKQGRELIGIALLMVLFSAGLALLIAYILGRPLKRITAASKALAIGCYDTRLPVDSHDELGQLSHDFNALAAALAQAEQTRRRWVADISHELRTPLAVLRGELEALQDGVRPLTPMAVDSLYSDVMRLTRLTEDLYQLSLTDQGTLSYRKSPLDPVLVLQQDLAALADEFRRKALTVTLDNALGKTILVYADADRLSQLFRNLLTNTLRYTDNGGELQITISKSKEHLLMVFSDSAPSVADAALPQLFDRFFRADHSRNRNSGGAGLGLAICHNIVEAHNGSITASHSNLGGLTMTLSFPISS
ncbi:ATP-binding protein [Methylosoma difficile]